jgi:small GTP-binding protein
MSESNVKICLLGGSGVGKTCIINRFSNNLFDENSISTSGGSYSVKDVTVNGKTVHCDVWDTAGQEKFRSLTKHFYKDAYIVCFVYDITSRDSFDQLKGWYNDLKQNGEKYTVLAVVGNKTDLYEKEEVNEEEARQYAESIGAEFQLVSAKTGQNVTLLFEKVVRVYLGPEFTEKVEEMKKDKGEGTKITAETIKKPQKQSKKFC